jgi:hypothetical protein
MGRVCTHVDLSTDTTPSTLRLNALINVNAWAGINVQPIIGANTVSESLRLVDTTLQPPALPIGHHLHE